MVNLRDDLIRASESHFLAHIEKHRINVENLLNNAVGVGDHADIMDTIEKEIAIIAEYDDKLETLNKYFPIGYEGKDTKELLNG
tara:strand:+ start:326 stop:577 length:252 start_codon:yes stop_codon:yes gene_type:complete